MKKSFYAKRTDKFAEEKRVTLDTNKNLGGIGALLMFLGTLPVANSYGILELVGLILVLIALYGLGKYYMESGIFNNALYGVITAIVGGVVFAGVAFVALVGFFSELGFTGLAGLGDITSFMTGLAGIDWMTYGWGIISDFILYILLALVVLFVFVVITAVFMRRSLGLLSARTGVGLFGTAGILLLVGAILTIIAIGAILIWISFLLIAIAFFQIKSEPAGIPPPPQM